MAEQTQQPPHVKTRLTDDESLQGPSTSQVLAVVTLFPLGEFLLFLAAVTLVGTLIGAALATPVFLLFSPILVPAVLAIAASVVGFITSGAFGITALSSVSWLLNYIRRMRAQGLPEQLRQRVEETARHVGQRAQEVMKP